MFSGGSWFWGQTLGAEAGRCLTASAAARDAEQLLLNITSKCSWKKTKNT